METNYVLKSGDLKMSFDKNPPEDLITDNKMLYHWLRSNPSENIKGFDYWYYTINEKEFCFKLERIDRNNWNVYRIELPEEIYTTFENLKGIKLIDDFEAALRKK